MTDKTDAEAVPPQEPAAGTVDQQIMVLEDIVVEQQGEIKARDDLLVQMQDRLDALENRTGRIEDGSPPPAPASTIPTLPEGTKRYRSKFTELDVVKEGSHKVIIDGTPITRKAKVANFTGGVYQTSDPEMQEFLANHPDYGLEFVEDATAIRNHHTVEVIGGTRQAEGAPRNPLEVPLPG